MKRYCCRGSSDVSEPPLLPGTKDGIYATSIPLIMQDVPNLASELRKIARAAGEVQLQIYNNNWEELDVKLKADEYQDSSPITQADIRAAGVIREMLKKLDGSIPIVMEEGKTEVFEKRKEWDCHWCVDPLDGTKEFIKRNGQFTVNIGLIHKNRPVFGVVYVPVQDDMYYGGTLDNHGSFKLESGSTKPKRLKAATFSRSDENLTLVMSASHANQATMDFVKKFKNPTKKSMGSSLKLLLVAEGEAHCYPRIQGSCEWDTAAAHAIVNGAEGRVVIADVMRKIDEDGKPKLVENPDGGKDVWYNKESSKNPYFVVWGNVTK